MQRVVNVMKDGSAGYSLTVTVGGAGGAGGAGGTIALNNTGTRRAYVHDRREATTLSVMAAGFTPVAEDVHLSADGRYAVVRISTGAVYLRDRFASRQELLSNAGATSVPAVSADGNYAAVTSSLALVPGATGIGVFVLPRTI